MKKITLLTTALIITMAAWAQKAAKNIELHESHSRPVLKKINYKGKANQQDSLALVALYNATNGSKWVYNTNWLTGKLNDWHGVYVNKEGRVTTLDLGINNLVGTIPPEIGNLTELKGLHLKKNSLTGSLPVEFGNLTKLQYIDFFDNQLTGNIPSGIANFKSLYDLNLTKNNFTGEILPYLVNIYSLSYINLALNNFTGIIPAKMANLTYLEELNLWKNEFNGPIPPALSKLSFLEELDLGYNYFTGTIPPEIFNLSKLTMLGLEDNQLHGNIPPEIGKLTNLTSLALYNNQLTGSIPVEIKNLTLLNYFSVAGNQLTGKVPVEINNLTNLLSLYLYDNCFDSLPDLSSLELGYLEINNNCFTFEDIEPTQNVSQKYTYSPQAKIGSVQHHSPTAGAPLKLSCTTKGTANTYQWYKNQTEITGATNNTYTINNYTPATDSGIYTCKVNNTIATKLTLETKNIYVGVNVTQYNIETTAMPPYGGSVTGNGTYKDGEQAELTAVPATGYRFLYWAIDDENPGTENKIVSTNSTYTFEVDSSLKLQAHFNNKYFITATPEPNYGGSVKGTGEYSYGDKVSLIANKGESYIFSNWEENNSMLSEDTIMSFTVTGDRHLIANFEYNYLSNRSPEMLSTKVYPNPASAILTIEKIKKGSSPYTCIKLYSITGVEISSQTYPSTQETINMNVSQIPAGMYFLQIQEGKKTETLKILIH